MGGAADIQKIRLYFLLCYAIIEKDLITRQIPSAAILPAAAGGRIGGEEKC